MNRTVLLLNIYQLDIFKYGADIRESLKLW